MTNSNGMSDPVRRIHEYTGSSLVDRIAPYTLKTEATLVERIAPYTMKPKKAKA